MPKFSKSYSVYLGKGERIKLLKEDLKRAFDMFELEGGIPPAFTL